MNGNIAVIVHGGAGRIPDADVASYNAGNVLAASKAREILESGGSAIDAALAAVRFMDCDPCFNSGYGSALDVDGKVYLDGSVMEGRGLNAGAVAAVPGIIGHPAELARLIMEKHPSLLLAGEGALEFAKAEGMEILPDGALVTSLQIERWKNWLARRAGGGAVLPGQPEAEPDDGGYDELLKPSGDAKKPFGNGGDFGGTSGDTVGAVCRDMNGLIACALSTGGVRGKPRGRVGDTAAIGCGLYADNAIGGAACTGIGEHIMRARLASRALDLIERGAGANSSEGIAQAAASSAVEFMARRIGGEAGVILLDAFGNPGYAHSTIRMAVAYWTPGMSEPAADMDGKFVGS